MKKKFWNIFLCNLTTKINTYNIYKIFFFPKSHYYYVFKDIWLNTWRETDSIDNSEYESYKHMRTFIYAILAQIFYQASFFTQTTETSDTN